MPALRRRVQNVSFLRRCSRRPVPNPAVVPGTVRDPSQPGKRVMDTRVDGFRTPRPPNCGAPLLRPGLMSRVSMPPQTTPLTGPAAPNTGAHTRPPEVNSRTRMRGPQRAHHIRDLAACRNTYHRQFAHEKDCIPSSSVAWTKSRTVHYDSKQNNVGYLMPQILQS